MEGEDAQKPPSPTPNPHLEPKGGPTDLSLKAGQRGRREAFTIKHISNCRATIATDTRHGVVLFEKCGDPAHLKGSLVGTCCNTLLARGGCQRGTLSLYMRDLSQSHGRLPQQRK